MEPTLTEQANQVQVTLGKIPQPPIDASFKLIKIEKVSVPHPFCITPAHVAYAADHCGGILSNEAIKRSGAKCGMKDKRNGRCLLSLDEHETFVTLFIGVPQNKDLNAVDGLHAYLLSIKDEATTLGVQGFAFPVLR